MSLLTILGVLLAAALLGGLLFWLFRRSSGIELTSDERALLKGKTFDQYVLKKVRKRATMSTMFQAVDRESKKSVAIRILHPEYSSDPEQVKAFQRRGEILEYLNKEHPDLPIVRLMKHGTFRFGRHQRPFIAVEYIDALDLGELLEQKKILSVAEATSIISQISKVLTVVLREKVWHHQMALQAIMVRYPKSGSPQVALADFDLHKQESATSQPLAGGPDSKLIFMSPEQFDNKIVDDRSDIYSLGVLYYTLLTGRPPFVGSDYGEMGRAHKNTPPPPLPESIPGPVAKIIARLLEKQPISRYQKMDEVAAAFAGLHPEPSWSRVPDASGVRPFAAPPPKPQESGRPSPGAPERKSSAARTAKPREGGFARFIFVELPLMVVSFIGRLVGAVLSKLSMKKIVIGVLLIVVAVVAFILFRTESVSGKMTVVIKDRSGKGVGKGRLVLDPTTLENGNQPYVKFTDLATDASTKGRFEAKATPEGTIGAEYSVSPGAKFVVQVSAEGFAPLVDTLRIHADSTISLSFVLKPESAPAPFVALVRDREKNPIAGISVRVKGKSGREYTGTTDARGGANLEYDVATEGSSPTVELSAPGLGSEFAQSSPKVQQAAEKLLKIDINDYFPYNVSLDRLLGRAESLIKEEEWKDALEPLQQAVALRSGVGSGKAYAMLAQAWFEEDNDNFNEALKAARKALADERNVTGPQAPRVIEKMHFYNVLAIYEAWDRSKDAGTKQEVRTACRNYLNLFKGGSFAALRSKNREIQKHEDKVKDLLDDVK